METNIASVALPIALGIIMLGLGLHLTFADFARIARQPRPAVVALACQLLLLPAICFALVLLFALPPTLAVGMMLLAASPGGTTAALYSHLFRGDVALNISLTAVNSLIAIVSLPIVVNLSLAWFDPGGAAMGLAFGKVLEVFLVVLVPVVIGMAVRRMRPGLAAAMDRPVRIASVVILLLVVAGAVAVNFELLANHLGDVIGITASFCIASLALGYAVPRWFGIARPQAIASSFEVGIHNATLAIVVAQTVLGSLDAALPAAIYGVIMFPLAAAFGFVTRGRGARAAAVEA